MDRGSWHYTEVLVHCTKPSPRKRNAKRSSEETLLIAEKKREAKGKGEKERYQLNAEFQRIVRRDNKASLSDQWKEIEETIEQQRLEISSRKSEIPREHSCKDGHNKGQNSMDLTEAEDIKRCQECTEELYKKYLHDPDNHNGVITPQSQTP